MAASEFDPRVLSLIAPGVVFFVAGLRLHRRHRLLVATPTTPVRQLRAGPAEVYGRALRDATRQPVTFWDGEPCAFAAWRVEDQGENRILLEGNTGAFFVEDATGVVLVDPEGAACEHSMKLAGRSLLGQDAPPRVQALLAEAKVDHRTLSGLRRPLAFLEFVVPEGSPVYVYGRARKDPRSLELLGRRLTGTALTLARGGPAFVIAASEAEARRHDRGEGRWLLGVGAFFVLSGAYWLLEGLGLL